MQREAVNPSVFDRRLMLHDWPHYESPRVGRERAWDKRYAAVFRFVAEQGHLPKQRCSPHERGLQRWFYKQRLRFEAGELDPQREESFGVLGEWRR